MPRMAYLRNTNKRKHIFVLLGPSGCGKTSFGQAQVDYSGREKVMLLSTGVQLRNENVLSAWHEADMNKIEETCRKMMKETLENFKKSETHQLLILDCVKDLSDAEFVTAEASIHGLEVTAAFLFDISPEDLHENWARRSQDRDIFRGSARLYLNHWKNNSVHLLNYYLKANILCTKYNIGYGNYYNAHHEVHHLLKGKCELDETFKFLASPNSARFLPTNSAQIKNVFAQLNLILKVNQLRFTLPASFVHCHRDVTWVTNPSRYHITAKTDGVRCVLLKIHDGTYLITRKNEIYPCCIADDKLPYSTVLDGELLPSASISEIHPKISTLLVSSVFMVFDVLAVSGEVFWTWPFNVRHETLCKLPISKDIAGVMKQSSRENESLANQNLPSDKENCTNELIVSCIIKEHMLSSPDEVLKVLCSMSQIPYPCDGLIFTPNTAYAFGPDPLLFKWQSEDSLHCDILLQHLKSGKRECVPVDFQSLLKPPISHSKYSIMDNPEDPEKVIECQWNQLEMAWDPLFMRKDKSSPNSDETIDHVEKLCQQPYTVQHFIADLTEIAELNVLEDTTDTRPTVDHPSLSLSFDSLYAKITELVQLGYVEKTVDSGFEILNYSTNVSDPFIFLCRGLVLHPDSKTIVTKPFIRFFEDVDEHDPDEMVEATIKYDGSLGIAFLWKDKMLVTTRRRMNSEQAIWAQQWISDHCDLSSFQAGYTYLFEIINQSNAVIVNYLFEGLVLLAITNARGHELPYEQLLECGRAIGFFMVTSRITARYSEVLWYCGGINLAKKESTNPKGPLFKSGALPVNEKRQEGWVVKFKDGRRQKVVYSWWKNASRIARLVHPQIVWLLVKQNKFEEVLGNVPRHFRVEIHQMIRALGRKFMETITRVEQWRRKLLLVGGAIKVKGTW